LLVSYILSKAEQNAVVLGFFQNKFREVERDWSAGVREMTTKKLAKIPAQRDPGRRVSAKREY
jgi:hypothetical protein